MSSGFLLDMGISPKVSQVFQKQGWQSVHVHEIALDFSSDEEILKFAKERNYVVITTDKDFAGHLAIAKGSTPSVITFRLENPNAEEQKAALERLISSISFNELDNCLITLERDRYRKRSLPIR